MKKQQVETTSVEQLPRREFFKFAGVAAGGAAATVVMAGGSEEAQAEAVSDNGRGYHETAHVREYYDLAKF